jgi:hypothetical protein
MSYDRMEPEAARLQQEIEAMLTQADAADTVDDNQFGDLSGDEIPEELKNAAKVDWRRFRKRIACLHFARPLS